METVNSKCEHCGLLMAVAIEFLGRPVRCPHCYQIVSAPRDAENDAASPADEALFLPRPATDEDSIFTPIEATSESVFAANEPTEVFVDFVTPRPIEPPTEPIEISETETFRETPDHAAAPPQAPPAEPQSAAFQPSTRLGQVPARSGDWRKYLLAILIPYAVFATAAAVYFFLQARKAPQGFEALPDVEGEHSGTSRVKPRNFVIDRVIADAELPARLWTRLGKPIRVGDVEVLAESVEQRKILFRYEGSTRRPTESAGESLVLKLGFRNLSAAEAFAPTDPAFVRLWRQGKETTKPYTFLDIDGAKFFGGACRWRPRGRRDGEPLEYIDGQDFRSVLSPGEAMTSLVCTDPDNAAIITAARAARGPLRWRVEVRRGPIRVHDRPVSACAVVGVAFDPSEITRK
jgi:hypothetical protein